MEENFPNFGVQFFYYRLQQILELSGGDFCFQTYGLLPNKCLNNRPECKRDQEKPYAFYILP